MENERYRKLGEEKRKEFDKNFNEQIDRYRKIAKELGFEGELKFVKEHWKVLIYVVI